MSGGLVFSCHALCRITLSASQSALHVCTQGISLCSSSCNKVPYLFVVHELLLRFPSLVWLTVVHVADKSISVQKTRGLETDAAPSTPRLLSVTALLSPPEPPEQSCTRLEETTIKHFAAIPGNSRNWNDWSHVPEGEHTWQLTAVGFPFRALAQQHWYLFSEIKASPVARETCELEGKDFTDVTERKQILQM